MESMNELELQYGIISKAAACVLILAIMALAMYMVWCWYKAQVAKEEAKVQKAKWQAQQTDIAWRHFERDNEAMYLAKIADLKQEMGELRQENKKLRCRLDTIVKAGIPGGREAKLENV